MQILKSLLAIGRERGFVTYDELNAVLPPDHVSSEDIESVMSVLSSSGIDVVEEASATRGSFIGIGYRETIALPIVHRHRHTALAGRSGAFAEIAVALNPGDRGSGFQFHDRTLPGTLPTTFTMAIERGLGAGKERGLHGFPLTDIRVSLIDGKYHDTDTSEALLEHVARACLRLALARAGTIFLEALMMLGVTTPENFLSAVVADLTGRCELIVGITDEGATRCIEAHIWFSDFAGYGDTLRTLTAGQGKFRAEPLRYDLLPVRGGPNGDDPGPAFPAAAAMRVA